MNRHECQATLQGTVGTLQINFAVARSTTEPRDAAPAIDEAVRVSPRQLPQGRQLRHPRTEHDFSTSLQFEEVVLCLPHRPERTAQVGLCPHKFVPRF